MATERSINVRVRLNGTDKFKKDMQGVTGSLSDMGGWLDVTKGILASDVIRQGLNAIANAIGESVDKSIEFETAMAGVQKTTGMTDAQLQAMANNLMDMSERIPMTATELANLAEIAGQLGIADKDIEEFIEVVAAMGVSTNLSADQAATSIARMANIMGTSAQDYERVGSVVVELGNNMATTESEIIDMAQQMAGVGSLVRMNEADVMAYAAALSSVGIEAEAGSTAISTLWTEMEIMTATRSDELEKFAQIAGMTSSEFANLWDTDSAGAFSKFISGLQQMGIEGESVMAILGELGVTNVRERKAITSLAGANDVLTESLAMAREEWKNNTALADEAGTYYETSASRIEMAQSKLENLQIASGDMFKPLVVSANEIVGTYASEIRSEMTQLAPLTDLLEDVNAEHAASVENIRYADLQVQALIDSLEEMGEFGSLDPAAQQEYLATLQLIGEYAPSAKSMIDLETGAIEGGTAALRENTQAARENAEKAAELERATTAYEDYVLVQEQVADKQALLTAAMARQADAEARLTTLQERQIELTDLAQQKADEFNAENGTSFGQEMFYDQVGTVSENGTTELYNLEQQIMDAQTAMEDASADVRDLSSDIAEQNAELEENAYVVDEYVAAMEAMGIAYEDAAESAGTLTDAEQEAVDGLTLMQMQLDALMTERDAAIDAAYERLNGVVKGFDKIETPEAVSTEDLLGNLQSQIDYMEQYRENLAAVQEMGLADEIVAQLSDGSEESAAILAGIVEDGGESIDELNAKYAEVGAAKDALATEMGEASIDFKARADEIVNAANAMVQEADQYGAAYGSGANTIQGIIDGMNSKLETLRGKVAQVNNLTAKVASAGSGGTSHAAGLTYVPFDGYIAQLHRGEMVLTALEARAYRAQQFMDFGVMTAIHERDSAANNGARLVTERVDNSVRTGDIYIRNETDINRLERQLTGRSRSVARGYGSAVR